MAGRALLVERRLGGRWDIKWPVVQAVESWLNKLLKSCETVV